jgi:hypothetical protein
MVFMKKHLNSLAEGAEIHKHVDETIDSRFTKDSHAKDSVLDFDDRGQFIAAQQFEEVFGYDSSDSTSSSSRDMSLITSLSRTLNASVDHPRTSLLTNGDDFIGTNETLHTLDISPSSTLTEEGPEINEVPKIF